MSMTTSTSMTECEWSEDPTDDFFGAPYVDVDEWRDGPAPHRYVHGGFSGTDTRFSFYFPPAGQYQERFFQHFTPVPLSENLAQSAAGEADKIGFATSSGAYFVETNGGGPDAANPFSGMDQSIGAYRANAAAARFSRVVAARIYGAHRPFGYAYGGSGGGFRTIGAAENTEDVWDGYVPYVIGSPMAIPNMFTVRMQAQRVLRNAFERIVDAYDVGGDPAALELDEEEWSAFDEVTQFGFPPRSWFGWRTMGMHGFSALYPGIKAADPSYFSEFWTTDGYLGADPSSSVHADRVTLQTTIAELISEPSDDPAGGAVGGVDDAFKHQYGGAAITGIRLAEAPEGWVLGAELTIGSGALAGTVARLSAVEGDLALLEPGQQLEGLGVGDDVVLDNGPFLAAQTYHRHQVPPEGYPVWDQFRNPDGTPRYPQRPMLLGPLFTANASGAVPTGRINNKMIVVACLLDREALPWQADWYRTQVQQHLGTAADGTFRLWYIENALHGDDEEQEFPTQTVSYLGALQTALRQVAAWVERGVEPAASTSYTVTDGQVHVPPTAAERAGIQPTISLTANGAVRATVGVGEPVTLRMSADTPPHAGEIVALAWDFTGIGRLGHPVAVRPARHVEAEQTVAFDAPGTYLVAVRATSQSEGRADDPATRVHNAARARVIVV